MNDQSLTAFRQQLEVLRDEILEDEKINDEACQTVDLDQSKVGRLSRMDAMQSQAMAQELKRRNAIHLREIAAALKRIDADDYGYCLVCDEEINLKRLAIDPATRYCVRCAEQQGN